MREFLFCAEMGVCPYFVHICVEIGVNEWTNTHCTILSNQPADEVNQFQHHYNHRVVVRQENGRIM